MVDCDTAFWAADFLSRLGVPPWVVASPSLSAPYNVDLSPFSAVDLVQLCRSLSPSFPSHPSSSADPALTLGPCSLGPSFPGVVATPRCCAPDFLVWGPWTF